MKNKFDKFAKELGWYQPYKNIPLYTKADKNNLKCVFDMNKRYFQLCSASNLDIEYVDMYLDRWLSKNIYDIKDSKWIMPLLVADYYAHDFDWENEIKWAKKAIKINKEVTPKWFSSIIRDKL